MKNLGRKKPTLLESMIVSVGAFTIPILLLIVLTYGWNFIITISSLYKDGAIYRGGVSHECLSGDYDQYHNFVCDEYKTIYTPIREISFKEAVDIDWELIIRILLSFTGLGIVISLYFHRKQLEE